MKNSKTSFSSYFFLILTISLCWIYACSDSSTDPGNGDPAENEIWMVDRSFTPESIEVETGTTITWSNESNEVHTVTSGTPGNADGVFNSGDVAPGGEFTYTFNESGTFDYFCIPHPEMTAEVIVVDPSNGDNGDNNGAHLVTIPGQSFNPSNLEVEVGSTVTWSNDSNETHTVTSGSPGNQDGVFDSGNLSPGEEFSFTFNEAGEFDYFCIPHPHMTATITVIED